MPKKIIIIGGTGYIGSGLVQNLQNRTVIPLSRSTCPPIDVYKPESIPPLDADELIFTAGFVKNTSGGFSALGLENCLKALVKPSRVIYISSLAALPSKDGCSLSFYGKEKASAEKLLERYQRRHAITVLRPCAVYGGENGGFRVLIRFIKRYRAYPVFPSQTVALLSLKDLCSAVQLCLDKNESIGKAYEVVENYYSWKEVSEYFAQKEGLLLEGGKPLPRLALIEGLFHEWKEDSSALRALGWKPSPLK